MGTLSKLSLTPAGKCEDFLLLLVNRPLLVLHSDAGYVGLSSGVKHLEGNCVSYVASSLSLNEEGYYNFQIGQYAGDGKIT